MLWVFSILLLCMIYLIVVLSLLLSFVKDLFSWRDGKVGE